MNRSDPISWPDESRIVSRNTRNATLDYIRNLFHNTGLITSVIYLALKFILVPCLEQQYSQRINVSASTLLNLRKLVSRLQNSISTNDVAIIGYNEHNDSVERCTQTSEDELKPLESSWSTINKRLRDSAMHLQRFVDSNSSELVNMNSFNMDARSLSDRFNLESRTEPQIELNRKMITSIREVKGWFINGRIY